MHGYVLTIREHVCVFAWEVRERTDLAPVADGHASTVRWAFEDGMKKIEELGAADKIRQEAEQTPFLTDEPKEGDK